MRSDAHSRECVARAFRCCFGLCFGLFDHPRPLTTPNLVQGPLLGEFPFVSGKAVRQQRASEGRCRAFVFAMRVEEELIKWPEAGQRQRAWVRQHMAIVLWVGYRALSLLPTDVCSMLICITVDQQPVLPNAADVPNTPVTQFPLPEALRVLKSDWMREAILAWVARCGWDAAQLLLENAPVNTDAVA